MSRTRRSGPPRAAILEPVVEPPVRNEQPEVVTDAVFYPAEPHTVTEAVADSVQKSMEIPSEEALAIRRLRNTLIQKLFTPDRTQNSWTDLKATN